MKIKELTIQSQRKIIRNALNCMNYTKYFNSLDHFLHQHYNDQNQCVDIFSDYLNDAKAEGIINNLILKTLNSDINIRLSRNDYQGLEYTSDSHLQYSILIDDKDLTRELISKGARITEEEIQLATKYGRSHILEIMLDEKPKFNKNTIKLPFTCSSARLFWAPVQRWLGYEVDYTKVETLLKNSKTY
jgi:hypothetical protein